MSAKIARLLTSYYIKSCRVIVFFFLVGFIAWCFFSIELDSWIPLFPFFCFSLWHQQIQTREKSLWQKV
jgi:hypothetical protein